MSFSMVMWVWFTLKLSEGRAWACGAEGEGHVSWSWIQHGLVTSSTAAALLAPDSLNLGFLNMKAGIITTSHRKVCWVLEMTVMVPGTHLGFNSLFALLLHKSVSWLKVVFIHHISSGDIVNTLYSHVYHAYFNILNTFNAYTFLELRHYYALFIN